MAMTPTDLNLGLAAINGGWFDDYGTLRSEPRGIQSRAAAPTNRK